MPIVADFVLLRILPVYYIRVMDNVLSLMVPLLCRVSALLTSACKQA